MRKLQDEFIFECCYTYNILKIQVMFFGESIISLIPFTLFNKVLDLEIFAISNWLIVLLIYAKENIITFSFNVSI